METKTPSYRNMRACEGPGGHPTLFWEVATGLGGVVGKKGAGDGGFHIKIYFSFINRGNSVHQPQTIAHKINKHQSQRQNALTVLHLTRHNSLSRIQLCTINNADLIRHNSLRRLKLGTIHYADLN